MTISRIFKELQEADIQKIVCNLYGSQSKIEACKLMKGGLFNTTYFVKTDAARDGIVLRVAPINQHLLFDFEKSMMSAEPLFYSLLKEHSIPTSEVIHYDNSNRVVEREYIIFKYIESLPMNQISAPLAVKARLYKQLGEIIRRLHGIKSYKFGWLRPHSALMMHDRWGAFLHQFAREVAEKNLHYGLFHEEELQRFLNIFSDEAVFDPVDRAHMVHADLWEGNVLVRHNEGQWDVAALIDVDKAIFGDKEYEYASDVMHNQDFINGYGLSPGESAPSKFRRNAYKLLERFMYAYIWVAQFDDGERHEAAKRNGLLTLAFLESNRH